MRRPSPDKIADEAVISVDHPCVGSDGEGNPSNEFIGVVS